MRIVIQRVFSLLSLIAASAFAAEAALAQDAVKAAPAHFKVLLDNDRVRVLEFRGKPGDKLPMHSHPAYVTYNFSASKIKFSFPDGKTRDAESKAGDTAWHEPETHAGEMLGTAEARVLVIELKQPPKK